MKTGKNLLSQYLRTQCDRQLYLSMFDHAELKEKDLPLPVKSQPVVHILRQQGKEWEQSKFEELANAFGPIVIAHQKADSTYGDIELQAALESARQKTAIIIQGRFNNDLMTRATLSSIGLSEQDIAKIPRFTAMVPDILQTDAPQPDEQMVLPDGSRKDVDTTAKTMIRICDIKHTGESNSSYASEVTLYAILLANWLKLTGMDNDYAVSTAISLWTRQKNISEISRIDGRATLQQKLQAFRMDTEPVDFPTYMQAVRHFFAATLPKVATTDNWQDLEWHVDNRCTYCDWLGYTKWMSSKAREMVEQHEDQYCYNKARRTDHLSRIALITRGAQRTLKDHGITTTAMLADKKPADKIFDSHNALRANRKRLPGWAKALSTGPAIAPHTVCSMPAWADLEIFMSVDFDPGTNLLTGLGIATSYWPPKETDAAGQPSPTKNRWGKGSYIVDAPTEEQEKKALLAMLQQLSQTIETIRQGGGNPPAHEPATISTQIYFWNKRQFKKLTDAIGRHLDAIIAHGATITAGLPWLFPPSTLLKSDYLAAKSPITYIQDIVKRTVFLPITHAITLFNTAETYHYGNLPAMPDGMYRDPLSDAIPRQRIYEIWSNMPMIKAGTETITRQQCIDTYANTIVLQLQALAQVTWKLRKDLHGKLAGEAAHIDLAALQSPTGLNPDSSLWLGWAKLEEACTGLNHKAAFAADPQELEAKYESMRLRKLLGKTTDGTLVYEVEEASRDVKFADSEKFLALQDEKIDNFLNLKVHHLTGTTDHHLPGGERTTGMNLLRLYQATLSYFNRSTLQAGIKLTDFKDIPRIRAYLEKKGLIDITKGAALVSAPGPSPAERTERCLLAIGNPEGITPHSSTATALGQQDPPETRREPARPIRGIIAAHVLWNAKTLSERHTHIQQNEASQLIERVRTYGALINNSQANAIKNSLTRRLSVIWGPPGTGKTKTAAAIAMALIENAHKKRQTLRLMLTGPTYIAWEQLMENLSQLIEQADVQNVRMSRIYSTTYQNPQPQPWITNPGVAMADIRAANDSREFQDLMTTLYNPKGIIVVGAVAHTCYRFLPSYPHDAKAPLFDYAIIDESSQLDIQHALPILNTMQKDSALTLCGDHLQMPPITQTDPPVGAEIMVGSIQTYLQERFDIQPQPLLENYRSSQPFVEFARQIGYPKGLQSASPRLALSLVTPEKSPPAEWPDKRPFTPYYEDILDPRKTLAAITYQDGRSGQANEFEGQMAVSLALMLRYRTGVNLITTPDSNHTAIPHTDESFWSIGLGIVTPHRAQRSLIIRHLKEAFPHTKPGLIEKAVDTVERFQGGERQTIMISFGIGDPDLIQDEESFLLQLERTNVAISRAMAKCLVLISEELTYHLPGEKDVIRNARAIKTYTDDICTMTKSIEIPDLKGHNRKATLRWYPGSTVKN